MFLSKLKQYKQKKLHQTWKLIFWWQTELFVLYLVSNGSLTFVFIFFWLAITESPFHKNFKTFLFLSRRYSSPDLYALTFNYSNKLINKKYKYYKEFCEDTESNSGISISISISEFLTSSEWTTLLQMVPELDMEWQSCKNLPTV